MKKTLLSLLILLGSMPVWAEGSALRILLTNGETAYYILSEKPTITFGETTMQVKANNATTEYQRAEVENFTFVDKNTLASIDELAEGATAFQYQDNTIQVAGAPIEVYNGAGKLVKQGIGTVSLNDQPQGTYVVKMKQQTIKVLKK